MILFRCDSSFEIGTGHVARCLNLAGLIQQQLPTEEIEFFCLDLPGNVSQKILDAGFKVHGALPDMTKCRWVVVDHYSLDASWEKTLPVHVKIFAVDDLANRPHHCQVLVDQNYRSQLAPYKSLVPDSCKLLLGPKYSLLKASLTKASGEKKISSPPQIVCFFGGSDEPGYLLKLARALENSNTLLRISLVALSSHRHLKALTSLTLPKNIQLLIDPADWTKLLRDADFYFGSGGTVTWERMYLGLPGAVLAVADNQVSFSADLQKDGFQHYWGTASQFDFSQALEKLEGALKDQKSLVQMSAKSLELVDRFSPQLIKDIFKL